MMLMLCFSAMFERCKKLYPSFEIGKTLFGVVVDWSDAEANGLRDAVGSEAANKLLKGCQVHWIRSYQRAGEQVVKSQATNKRKLELEAFGIVAAQITKAKSQQDVFKLFQCLLGSCTLSEIQYLAAGLTEDHVSTVNNTHWSAAKNWVSWWTRLPHLRMLNSSFSDMDKQQWDKCPTTMNAVERKNKDSKGPQPLDLKQALLRVYRIDKASVFSTLLLKREFELGAEKLLTKLKLLIKRNNVVIRASGQRSSAWPT